MRCHPRRPAQPPTSIARPGKVPTRHRNLATRVAAVVVAAAAMLLVLTKPADAHPFVVSTLPQAGYAVATSPAEIGLRFDERVTFRGDAITVDGLGRGRIATSGPVFAQRSRLLTVKPRAVMASGRYTVRWEVIGKDGHPVTGTFSFGVGAGGLNIPEASTTQTPGLAGAAAFRWLVFAGLAAALGGLLGDRLVRSQIQRASTRQVLRAPRPWVVSGSLAGLLGAAGLAINQLGGGSVIAGLQNLDFRELISSGPGRMLALELLGFAMAAMAGTRARGLPAVLALAIVIGAEAGRNHVYVKAGASGWLLVALHLAAAAVWVGALVHVCRSAFGWRNANGEARALFVAYGLLAGVLYATVVATGTVNALIVLPSFWAIISTSYGWTLLAKLVLFGVISGTAYAARRRLHSKRTLGRGLGISTLVTGERAMLVVVLVLTAVLSSMAPPVPAVTETMRYPPPIMGGAIRLGALVGQVNVGLVAAPRHLEVHLEVPESAPGSKQVYRLTGQLTGPGGDRSGLRFQPCGYGCFYATPVWKPGQNAVQLRVAAPGWAGGVTTLRVPWPMRRRTALLQRALDELARQKKVTVVERVSSDTSRPAPPAETTRISGKSLLESEPYKSGRVGTVVQLRRTPDGTWIGFGLPSQQISARLLVAPDGRLLREEIVSPRHLIRHTFAYPDGRGVTGRAGPTGWRAAAKRGPNGA